MTANIAVRDHGAPVEFSFEDMLRYSGPGSPGGVALGLKMMERAFALLAPDGLVERREVVIRTAFRGPGARDACELVTRAVTDGRYVVDLVLERPERGHALATFAFRVGYRDRSVSLLLREGFVTDEFVRLAQSQGLSPEERGLFVALKQRVADQLMASDAVDVFVSPVMVLSRLTPPT
ncbi:MAG: hypothetical protein ACRDZW_04015 [Acidimicrobiales bacterium]